MFKRLLLTGFILVMVATVGTSAWYYEQYQRFNAAPVTLPLEGLNYTIKPGANIRSVGRDLQKMGVLVEGPMELYFFRWLARESKTANRIKAGELHIPSGVTPRQLLQVLVEGKEIQYSITFLEGWNFKEMRRAVEADVVLKQTLLGKTQEELMTAIGHPGEHPEGRFLPDTYHFPRGDSDVDVYKRAYVALETVLQKEWDKRQKGLPLKTPYEALILASIIEKETGAAEERPQIAGVFVRRLNKKMLLQTDPTVIYGMGEAYKGNIRRKDLRKDTPYNTYTRKGLTPTPIAMPGRDAIHAAVNPTDGKSIYFVAKADGSGTHYFSATLKEHNRAVRKYQLKK